jgi:ABC-type nickel/cobalt efflux system permease component RcnA
MKDFIFKLIFFVLIINAGCSSASKPDPLLEEAFQVHNQYLQIAAEAEDMLKKLPTKDSFRLVTEPRLEEWYDNIIEVPGFEHEHNHDHDHGHHHHHHNHHQQIEVSPEVMLGVQRELRDSVQVIKEEILEYTKAN